MVTKQQLDQLRAERNQNNARLDYTINGPIKTQVVSTLENERERKILLGDRAMLDALRNMQREQALSALEGLATAHFNKPEITL